LYCALFWIQGKTGRHYGDGVYDCTVPYFGFKAKQLAKAYPTTSHCTVPYFGFKAKQDNWERSLLANCTVPYFGFKAKQAAFLILFC